MFHYQPVSCVNRRDYNPGLSWFLTRNPWKKRVKVIDFYTVKYIGVPVFWINCSRCTVRYLIKLAKLMMSNKHNTPTHTLVANLNQLYDWNYPRCKCMCLHWTNSVANNNSDLQYCKLSPDQDLNSPIISRPCNTCTLMSGQLYQPN